MRKVIVHYHLFKNAGTSIDRALKEVLGDRWLSFDRSNRAVKISAREMEEFILDHPDGIAFSSHQVVPPLPTRHLEVVPIVFLRHPIDRAYSAYLFESKLDSVPTPVSFEAYIMDKFESSPRRSAIEDFQTLHLANREYERWAPSSEPDDEAVLASARGLLHDIRYFGIVEQYDRGLELLNTNLAEHFPGMRLRSYRMNVQQEDELSIGTRIRRIRSELSREAYAELILRNQLDLRLYEYAVGRFSALPAQVSR